MKFGPAVVFRCIRDGHLHKTVPYPRPQSGTEDFGFLTNQNIVLTRRSIRLLGTFLHCYSATRDLFCLLRFDFYILKRGLHLALSNVPKGQNSGYQNTDCCHTAWGRPASFSADGFGYLDDLSSDYMVCWQFWPQKKE
jgi:hypothetical protein